MSDPTPEALPPTRNVIAISENGPIHVTGDIELRGAAADPPGSHTDVWFCRCGQSQSKPFCDGAHRACDFTDPGQVGTFGRPGLEAEGGALVVTCSENGPLLLAGNMSIVDAAGEVAWQGKRCALCRCGQSQNKPFCDGAHKACGFTAPGR